MTTAAQALRHQADVADLPEELHSVRALVRERESGGQSDPELQALVLAALTIQAAGADLSPDAMLRESRELMAALRASGTLSHDEMIQAVVDAAFQRLTEAPSQPSTQTTPQSTPRTTPRTAPRNTQAAAFSVRT
jgi:hypothetical protein